VAGEHDRYRSWNLLAVFYPAFFAFMSLAVLRLPLPVGIAVAAVLAILTWLKQPLALVLDEDQVVFVVLPFWVRGVVVKPADLAVAIKPWTVTFEDRSRRRLPVFRKLSWGRDLVSKFREPPYIKRLRAIGSSVKDDE
jgi:hypothetical protein